MAAPSISEDWVAVSAKLPDEAAKVAAFIADCYEDMSPSPEAVLEWTRRSVFAPNLWIWIRDRRTRADLALGIAELDRTIGEASLEWVQVHPDARRQGVGRSLVIELLRRSSQGAKFATVSGRAGSPAESLYRSCGFVDVNIWWCLRR